MQSKAITGFAKAAHTYNHDLTDGDYLYPAVVRSAAGETVHYGDWPVQKDIGTLGVFYWEYEDGGSNSGYHFSYVGTSQGNEISSANNDTLKGDSLCEEHDDGGVVTNYGYGYFYANSNTQDTSLGYTKSFNNTFRTASKNDKAAEELGKQMPGYTFVAYETGNNMYLTDSNPNGVWQLDYGKGTQITATYTYTINPFFANAISLDKSYINDAETVTNDPLPGQSANAYEVRSVSQLQYINWNYAAKNTSTSILSPDWDNATLNQAKNANPYRSQYPYLVYGESSTAITSLDYYWNQSHDLDAAAEYAALGKTNNFTPIGSMYDNGGNTAKANPLMAYFTSSFDGQAYAIKNIAIKSKAECVGIFGITSGAVLKNVVVYSNNGSVIEAAESGRSWYCVGGLVGFAASRNIKESAFTNCTVSGYTIKDNHKFDPGWGGGNVGGLVGMTNMNITNCSAVTDIIINIGYNGGYQNLRVGGIAGVSRGTVNYCYAGGSISSITSQYHNTNFRNGASIWVGGLVGGIVVRNGGLDSLIGTVSNVLKVSNSYSYVEMPQKGSDLIKSSQAIASNGEMQEDFADVKNDYIEIYNCYALESAVLKTDDYLAYGRNNRNWYNLNLNMTHQDKWGREIKLYNDSKPYLTYAEMQSGDFLTKLNKNYQSGAGYMSFSTVTVTEQGQNIDGKYSFPGNDTTLQGLNYPFPTVLRQTDIFGDTVNVHYGRWPKVGLLWEENSQKLDLLADIKTKAQDSTISDNEDGKALLQTHLLVASSDVNTSQTPKITLWDEEGNALKDADAAAVLSSIKYNAANKCYDVTFIGQNVGTVIAKASLGNYEASLTIQVTAELKLEASSTNISVYEGDKQNIQLTVKDANDKMLLAETEKSLKWEINVDNNGAKQDVIECSIDDIKLNADGTFTLPLTGFAAGEATVRITCTYHYGSTGAADPGKEIVATLYISAVTKASDVLGLSNGGVYNQISLPHTPKADVKSYTGAAASYTENAPSMKQSTLFLYATSEYSDLSGFNVEKVEITDGDGSYTTGADGVTTDANHTYKVTVNDKWTREENDTKFQYRAVSVASAKSGEITLKLTLNKDGVMYTLTAPYTIASSTYTVRFLDAGNNPVVTKQVAYGETPQLTDEEQATLNRLSASVLGFKCTWDFPQIFADTDIPMTQTENTYTISFDANGGTGTMAPVSYPYTQATTAAALPACTFSGGTNGSFKGWATEPGGEVVYNDMASVKEVVARAVTNGTTEITLYAVWG